MRCGVQVIEMRLVLVGMAPPAFLERGSQDKARGPFDSHEYVVCFQWIQPVGKGGGGGVLCVFG